MKPKAPLPLRAVFAVPLVLAVATIVGLVSALLGDGILDVVSWVALTVPLLPVAWAFRPRKGG